MNRQYMGRESDPNFIGYGAAQVSSAPDSVLTSAIGQVRNLTDRITDTEERLASLGNRAFGEVPQDGGTERSDGAGPAGPAVHIGRAEMLFLALNDMGFAIARLELAEERVRRLA